ncbi:uncharacterized protein LOC131599379 [Vicia villosa]|uniref:uncharacterized protein LOC131599379 n=1 Tax=Vicia villosa TaxID=3911 RepID=UPI00273B9B62|nr:uncharacterized protein LOC131599379 [Vicia villosa]
MARSEMKNVVMIMIMFILAQASYSLMPAEPADIMHCTSECATKCVDKLGNKFKYAYCVGRCVFKCSKSSSQFANDCTIACASSKLNNINTDAHGVNAIVNSCLKTCQDKS